MNTESHLAQESPTLTPPVTANDRLSASQMETLRGITRKMATAEDLETVLKSIVSAIVELGQAVQTRIFLIVEDHECAICRARIEAGEIKATPGRALHMLASAGVVSMDHMFHKVPLDSDLPTAQLLRAGRALHVEDWRPIRHTITDPRVAPVWEEMGVVGAAGYPLVVHGEQIGSIGYLCSRAITQEEFEVLGVFADQAAIAIKSATLFQQLEQHKRRLQVENAYLQDELRIDRGFDNIVGASPALRAVLRKVRQVAHVETTVLLTGETGTGKELIARAIHDGSPRKDRALIKINCGAIPEGIVESELFGHEKGAFTGALQRRIGRFELADKGTLFMDEVGELPLDTQVKLLRVLQEQEFERVGSTKPMKVDVRLVAATNRDVEREVAEGRFRADLFYRLNVFPIRIPPLRERTDDIPLLVDYFLAQFQRKLGKSLKGLTPESMQQLQRYPWPGNIRELQNVLERACVVSSGPVVSLGETLRMSGSAIPVICLRRRSRRCFRSRRASAPTFAERSMRVAGRSMALMVPRSCSASIRARSGRACRSSGSRRNDRHPERGEGFSVRFLWTVWPRVRSKQVLAEGRDDRSCHLTTNGFATRSTE
jgi:formate hydrogenlyase transcriptional activator